MTSLFKGILMQKYEELGPFSGEGVKTRSF